MSRRIQRLFAIAITILSIAIVPRTFSSAATNDPFTCQPGFYQVVSGQFKQLNTTTGAYTNIGGKTAGTYNAMGYNVLDNYIYGMSTAGQTMANLIRIGSDGTVTPLGVPSGITVDAHISGDMDRNGNLWIRNNGKLAGINVATKAVSFVTPSKAGGGADMVFINNTMYSLDGTTLYRTQLPSGTVTSVTVAGVPAGGGYGAGWTDNAGNLYFSLNGKGTIYLISNFTGSTPTATAAFKGAVTDNNDGASCPDASSPLPATTTTTAAPTTTTVAPTTTTTAAPTTTTTVAPTTTTTVAPTTTTTAAPTTTTTVQTPSGPVASDDNYDTDFDTPLTIVPASGLLNNDSGSTIVLATATTPAHGSVSTNADGSFSYTPDAGFSGTDTFDYTITDSLNQSATATVTLVVRPQAVVSTPTPPVTAVVLVPAPTPVVEGAVTSGTDDASGTAVANSSATSLAQTGTETRTPIIVGFIFLMLGGAFLVISRRFRSL